MFSAASVSLSVCQHDNFRTIKRRTMKRRLRALYKNLTEFECQGQRSRKVTGDKKRKSAAFCSGVVISGAVLVRHFFGSGPWGRVNDNAVVSSATSTPVGKSAHAV